MRRCLEAGLSTDAEANSQVSAEDDDPRCHTFNKTNRRMLTMRCAQCDRLHHRNCVNISQVQASQLPVWHCNTCLRSPLLNDAVLEAPVEDEILTVDMAAALAELKKKTRLLQHVPCRLRHRVASDLASAITTALEQRTSLTWWRLFSFMFRSPLAEPTDPPQTTTPELPAGLT